MSDGMNLDVGRKLSDEQRGEERPSGWQEAVELIEVVLLAIVAVATAWSGFQATKWDGRQSYLYGQATRQRFAADAASTAGGQVLVTDVSLWTAWLSAHADNDTQLESIYQRRFSPAYATAFAAWLRTDPFTNPNAPAGPSRMPQYHNPLVAQAGRLNQEASAAFNAGTSARTTGDEYVRDTVLFASILFLVALAQRLKVRAARVGLNAVAFGLLVFVLISIVTLPRQ